VFDDQALKELVAAGGGIGFVPEPALGRGTQTSSLVRSP
jgi:hypothetical protein